MLAAVEGQLSGDAIGTALVRLRGLGRDSHIADPAVERFGKLDFAIDDGSVERQLLCIAFRSGRRQRANKFWPDVANLDRAVIAHTSSAASATRHLPRACNNFAIETIAQIAFALRRYPYPTPGRGERQDRIRQGKVEIGQR